jgi:hypothetical protein
MGRAHIVAFFVVYIEETMIGDETNYDLLRSTILSSRITHSCDLLHFAWLRDILRKVLVAVEVEERTGKGEKIC